MHEGVLQDEDAEEAEREGEEEEESLLSKLEHLNV